jgi:hypothetical protein
MEPNDEYLQFIRDNDYNGLMEYTNEILSTNTDDNII